MTLDLLSQILNNFYRGGEAGGETFFPSGAPHVAFFDMPTMLHFHVQVHSEYFRFEQKIVLLSKKKKNFYIEGSEGRHSNYLITHLLTIASS